MKVADVSPYRVGYEQGLRDAASRSVVSKGNLFEQNIGWNFADWKKTPAGGKTINRFIRLAIGLKRRGWEHYGAKSIIERIRWHEQLKAGPNAKWKINNDWTSRIARFAMERCPELNGFFRLRELKSE